MRQYDRELNKGMKVFSQLFVGLKEQSKGQCDLGFATPYEENAAGRKRQETVKSWCGAYWDYEAKKQKIRDARTKIIDNKPRGGFKITDDIKRVYWGGGNVVFRVYDPEGFELEIQSQNLMALIQVAGLNEGGVIPGYCLWGRDGANNILLHEKSEEYKNAILAAETLKKPSTVATSDRRPGMMYLLQTGETGIYLGKFWVTCDDYIDSTKALTDTVLMKFGDDYVNASVSTRVIGNTEQYEAVLFDKTVRFYKKASLVRVVEELAPLSTEEAEKTVNAATVWELAGSKNYNSSTRVMHVSATKHDNLKYAFRLMTEAEFKVQFDRVKEMTKTYFQPQHARNGLHTAGDMHFFYGGWPARKTEDIGLLIGLLIGTTMFGNHVNCRDYTSGRTKSGLGQYYIEGKALYMFKPEEYSNRRSTTSSTVQNIDPKDPPLEAFELPKFGTAGALHAWCQEQFDAGNLCTIEIKPTGATA